MSEARVRPRVLLPAPICDAAVTTVRFVLARDVVGIQLKATRKANLSPLVAERHGIVATFLDALDSELAHSANFGREVTWFDLATFCL